MSKPLDFTFAGEGRTCYAHDPENDRSCLLALLGGEPTQLGPAPWMASGTEPHWLYATHQDSARVIDLTNALPYLDGSVTTESYRLGEIHEIIAQLRGGEG